MKELRKRNRKTTKITFTIIVVIVVLCGIIFAYWYLNDDKTPLNTDNKDASLISPDNDGVDADTDSDRSQSDTATQPSTPNNDSDDKDYVSSPATPPATDEPFPVENEHYRIEKSGDKSFAVTLYPILNNPEYIDYESQLRDYKNKVLSYLKKRYGSIDDFTFKWTPKEAENV